MSPPNDRDPTVPTPPEVTEEAPSPPSLSTSQQPPDRLASQGETAGESPEPPGSPLPGGSGQIPPEVSFIEDLADPTEVWEAEGGTKRRVTQTPGKRKVIIGSPDYKKHGRRMTQELYESLWEAWRDGIRNKSRLVEMFTISWSTLNKALDKGYPKQGWRAIKERADEHDRAEEDAKRQARALAEVINSDEFKKARADNLKLIQGQKYALGQLVGKAVAAAQKAKFTKTRKTRDKEGKVIEIEVEPDAFDMADALRTIVSATKELGAAESFWLGGPESRTETVNTGPPKGWQQLSPEQLQWIVDHSGELPPGITEEMLRDGIPPHILASFQVASAAAPAGPKN